MAMKIPDVISDDEELLRTAYSPMHINVKSGKLRPACLKPMTKEPDEDDPSKMNNKVSVSRLDYAGWGFCLNHARNHQNERKTFYGFLKLLVKSVRGIGPLVKSKPVEDNPYHANIIFPDIDKPHEDELDELESAQVQLTLKKLLDCGQFVSEEEAEMFAGQQEEVKDDEKKESSSHIEEYTPRNTKNLISRFLSAICFWK